MNRDYQAAEQLFTGKSEMARQMRSLDWSQTSLGTIETWSQSLRSTLSICLNSRFPIAIYWGSDFTLLYNDAWRPIVGDKHPWALGRPGEEVWSEIWDSIGPELASVVATGEGTFHNDELLAMQRFGYTEECYFEYTFNPIQGQGGKVEGVFNVVTETTYRVLNDRRARLLREVASRTGTAQTTDDTCAAIITALRSNPADIPAAFLYLIDAGEKYARLYRDAALDPSVCPEIVDLAEIDNDPWSIALAAHTAQPKVIAPLPYSGEFPNSPWSEPPQEAIALPIATGQSKMSGVLVAIVSPRRRLDESYCNFFDQLAGQIAMGIANAHAYEEERKRAEALAEIDRAKTVFFSNVSHEFRTPLTLMLSPLEELLEQLNDRLQPEEREQLQLIQRNGLRLQKLVNTLLDFSRIEAGRVQKVYEPTDLAMYTTELASVFRSLIEQAGMRLVIDCPPLPELVYVDREMWEKIVLNLLSNAFKFTLEGEISVQLQWQNDQVKLAIQDTGIGIPANELPHLFKRFHQVKGAQGRSFEGSGIGLSLSEELVKLHGGTIDVTSTEGVGTCFTVSIPTGTDHLLQDQISAARTLTSTALSTSAYLEEALRWLPEEESGKWEVRSRESIFSSPTLHSPLPTPSTAKILLADDNADMRNYVQRLLSQHYEVQAVSDGLAALSSIRQQTPDLVLTDVMMPNLDGFGLLQALRSHSDTQEIPIILLSARAGEEARIEGLEAGADDYLIKPFSARELLARVEATLKLAQLRREAGIAIRESEEKYRLLFETMDQGFCIIEMVFDAANQPIDYRFLLTNPAFDKQTGTEKVMGKTIREIAPQHEDYWFEILGNVALTGESIRFENRAQEFQRWYEVHAFRLGELDLRRVGILFNDISDRKAAELEREQLLAQEQAAREEAQAANRIKDEFLAVLSHELRSPLNPILGWSKLLKAGNLDAAKTTQAINTIERNAKLQSELIEDLLDVSRILQGKLSLNVSSVQLASTIQSAIETVKLAAEAKSITIEAKLDDEVGQVLGDSTRLQQGVWNLLSNAVKFTPAGGRVEVRLERVDGQAQITISDNGKGIPASFLPHVFDYFRQEDGATTRRFGGLGLGLAIVRHLVELHGGTVQAESPGEGQGATFTVKIPLAAQSTSISSSDRSSASTPDLSSLQILIVDDEADSRDFVVFVLEQAGAIVTIAVSGFEALQQVERSDFDLIVSDIGMPEMDGYELMRQIRSLEQGRQIPAIALTAYAGEYNQRQAIQAGFQHHIGKPVEPEELVRVISTTCLNAAKLT